MVVVVVGVVIARMWEVVVQGDTAVEVEMDARGVNGPQ